METKQKEQFLTARESELSELIQSKDWSRTPLGPIKKWPQSLKTSVNLILNSQHPMWIGWGPEGTFLYNDAYIKVLSLAKHPWALGRPVSEVWSEIWDYVGPLANKVFDEGIPTFVEDVRLFMNRGGFLEETYYSFSYSPIHDEFGKVAGLFCPSAETTSSVLHARRIKTLSDLSSNTLLEKTVSAACASAFHTLRKNRDDIPFSLLYLIESESNIARLEQSIGVRSIWPNVRPEVVSLEDLEQVIWPMAEVAQTKNVKVISLADSDAFEPGCDGHPVTEAIVMPVRTSSQETPIGILIAGINPCRRLDTDYRTFYDLLSTQIATAIQNASAAEEERKRIEKLAEIDRAKTVFFSNVSHEFRTPLTLLLGPVEDVIKESLHLLPQHHRDGLQSTHRNAMRLYRLVNTLLDFSRIEAGKMTARFTPVDLASFTTDIASSFRSVIESAQMKLAVECQPISEPVYIDKQMWEKIVFNLLSNAYKYTLRGQITVSLKQKDRTAVLEIKDTGIGIPKAELPHMFERFHRVKNAMGRTFEGTGIGLSLVKELVLFHAGAITVDSTEGEGSTFTVSIPMGTAHLSSSEIFDDVISESSLAGVYVKEIESLMEMNKESAGTERPSGQKQKYFRVMIVDDNADMRKYLKRILAESYEIEEAENGKIALEKIADFRPDLIVSDIMMPVMDGVQLLNAVKKTPQLEKLPVIFLSARAGEESRIEGYELGADDYLVKPFSANELLARVKAQLNISKLRQYTENHLRNIFHHAPVIFVVFRGPQFIVEIANEKLLEYWQKTHEQTIGKPILEVLPEIANQGLLELLTGVLTTGIAHKENERPVPLLRNGKLENTYVSYTYEPLRNEDGEVTHVMVIANDITESVMARKKVQEFATELEQRVHERTKELSTANTKLEVSNRELEQFAYIASHDLQEPLRKIQTFSELLHRHSHDPALIEKYITKIDNSAARMARLIRDVLNYSRLSKTGEHFQDVDLNAILEQVKTDYELLIQEKHATIVGDKLPVIQGIGLQLNQLFSNLIGNSLKFSKENPVVKVSCEELSAKALEERPQLNQSKKYCVLSFSDNGIGFEQEYADKIFVIFQRLHYDNRHLGTGIGLALCKKIAENHHGMIEAYGELNKGATFKVYLPMD